MPEPRVRGRTLGFHHRATPRRRDPMARTMPRIVIAARGNHRNEEGTMRLDECMTRGVECTRLDATVQEAARMMRDLDVGTLPVCGEDDRPVGMVTDRDITVRAVANGQDPTTTRVQDVMTSGVVYCYEDQDLDEAARLME